MHFKKDFYRRLKSNKLSTHRRTTIWSQKFLFSQKEFRKYRCRPSVANDPNQSISRHSQELGIHLTDYFWHILRDKKLDDMWFEQDGATSHTAHDTIDLLKSMFDERVISRNGPVNWLLRSCDLTSFNFFLWGYVKSLVYAKNE